MDADLGCRVSLSFLAPSLVRWFMEQQQAPMVDAGAGQMQMKLAIPELTVGYSPCPTHPAQMSCKRVPLVVSEVVVLYLALTRCLRRPGCWSARAGASSRS